jgi:hypothetical protein
VTLIIPADALIAGCRSKQLASGGGVPIKARLFGVVLWCGLCGYVKSGISGEDLACQVIDSPEVLLVGHLLDVDVHLERADSAGQFVVILGRGPDTPIKGPVRHCAGHSGPACGIVRAGTEERVSCF